jgi:hypothetical protein
MNLNVTFQVVSFDLLPWHLNHLREGAYRRLNLRFYFLTFQRTVFNFKYKSLGKREDESVITLVRLAYVYYTL